MLIENDLKKLFHQLSNDEIAHIVLRGTEISVRIFENSSKISLTSPVYFGGNFIPKSVRQCTEQKPPFPPGTVKTYLTIDESAFQVHLNYTGLTQQLSNTKFRDLLEEFSWQAEEWKLFLDEHDKNDLVYVRVK